MHINSHLSPFEYLPKKEPTKMINLEKYPVSLIRDELNLTQVQIAEEAGITPESVGIAVKSGKRKRTISKTTARLILSVFNKHREKRGLPALAITDLDWQVRGYAE